MIEFDRRLLILLMSMVLSCSAMDRKAIVKNANVLPGKLGELVTIRGLITDPKGTRLSFEDHSGEVWLLWGGDGHRDLSLDGHIVVIEGRLGQIDPVRPNAPGEIPRQGFTGGKAWKLDNARTISIIQ